MPEFRIRETGEIVTNLAAAFPNVSIPVAMTAEDYDAVGADPVFPVPAPEVGQLEVAIRDGVEKDTKGNWVEKWVVRPMFSEYTDEDGVVHTREEQEAAYLARLQEEANRRLANEVTAKTQERLDTFARTRNYDGILSLCTYATSSVLKFQIEGQCGVNSRDATWAKLYEILDEVQAGTRPVPSSYADIEPELPVLEWPA